jgi:hypothetical protein
MDTTMGELVNPSPSPPPPPRVLTLIAQELTPEAFLPYGQVVRPVADNANYGPDDAQLDLSRGVPRYVSGSLCLFACFSCLFLCLFLSQLLGFASRFLFLFLFFWGAFNVNMLHFSVST